MKKLLAKMCVLSILLIPTVGYTAEKSPLCYFLNININSEKFEFITEPRPIPRAGAIVNWTKNGGTLQQTAYGPNMDFAINDKSTGKQYVYEVEQKLCFLEAGPITVRAKNSNPPMEYSIEMGSFAENKPGIVTFK